MRGLWTQFLNLLFPRGCPLCGDLTDGGTARLCAACTERIAEELKLPCPLCGKTAPECACLPSALTETVSAIGGCPHAYVGFYRPQEPESALSQLIYALKSNADDAAAQVLARMLVRELMRTFLSAGEDIRQWTVTYAPRSTGKRREAGFDHGERLAKLCAYASGARYAALFTRRGGREQKRLSESERRANAESSIRLRRRADCRDAKIILIDDVITSGATVAACAKLLRDAGAKAVFCASALKTEPHHRRKSPTADTPLWFEEE